MTSALLFELFELFTRTVVSCDLDVDSLIPNWFFSFHFLLSQGESFVQYSQFLADTATSLLPPSSSEDLGHALFFMPPLEHFHGIGWTHSSEWVELTKHA